MEFADRLSQREAACCAGRVTDESAPDPTVSGASDNVQIDAHSIVITLRWAAAAAVVCLLITYFTGWPGLLVAAALAVLLVARAIAGSFVDIRTSLASLLLLAELKDAPELPPADGLPRQLAKPLTAVVALALVPVLGVALGGIGRALFNYADTSTICPVYETFVAESNAYGSDRTYFRALDELIAQAERFRGESEEYVRQAAKELQQLKRGNSLVTVNVDDALRAASPIAYVCGDM